MKNSILVVAILGLAWPLSTSMPLHATPLGISKAMTGMPEPLVERVRVVRRSGAAVRRTAVVGPRGGAVVRRTNVVRPGWHGAGTRWARPAGYWWRPGGAIVAGAAVGFVSAAVAASWAGAAPGPNMCWYYADASHQQGFWDACP